MMLMIVLQMLYLQLRSKALNMTLAHHYTYQISQDSNSPMDWIHWLSTIPIVGSPLFQAHAHSVHALLFPSQSTNSSRNGYGSTVPHIWRHWRWSSLCYVCCLEKGFFYLWQSSSSKQSLENTQGTYEFSCKMFWERWSAVFISWST